MNPWWKRNLPDPEVALFVLCMVGLGVLLMLILVAGYVRAEGCLSITVPPQAVLGNHDGDTFQIFSFQPGGVIKIRVQGVNTPELSKKKGVPDEPGAREAKEFTRRWLALGPFTVSTCGKPSLDRIEATVSRGATTLAQDLVAAGLAR